jgi:regulatory Fis family protein
MADAGPNNELRSLAARITSAQGPGLFPAMSQYLAAMLHASEVVIGEAADALHARTLGVCLQGAVQPNYTFPLAGTPGEALMQAHSTEDAAPPPTSSAEADADAPGCFGMALHAADGRAIGFVCARSEGDLQISEYQHCLVEIVSVLLTTELQLLRAERERASLDHQVHRLKSQVDSLERAEITAAATGSHRVPHFAVSPLDLDDSESTGLHFVQREHILKVLNATRWVIEGNSGAALKLGMKPATLRHRMKKLGIARLRQQP